MTPAQILATVRAQVYEATAAFYTDAEIYSYMWQAEQEIANQVVCTEVRDSTSISSVTNTEYYSLPADVLYVERVEWNNTKLKKIDYRDRDSVNGGGYGGDLDKGDPYCYYQYGSQIGLFPVPQEAKTVALHYIQEPAQIVTASSAFTVPSFFAKYIPDFCLSRMYAKDQDDGRAKFHQGLWSGNILSAKQLWSQRQFKDALLVVKDSDKYPETELGMI